MWTTDGVCTTWGFQSAELNKLLVSVNRFNMDGWRVTFHLDESHLEHTRIGNTIGLGKIRGVFVVDAHLEADPKPSVSTVFSRPGN